MSLVPNEGQKSMFPMIEELRKEVERLQKEVERLQKENDELQQQLKNCNLQNVIVSLLNQKAIEYAKIIHQEEFDDPCFAPDVEQTIRDFKSGFEAAIRFSNER